MYHSFLSHSSADEHLGCFHVLGIINSAPSVLLNISIFSNESALHITLPKYWSFSISPSSEYSGSFRIDWFDLLAPKGLLKSLLQYHNLKASIFQCSAFFMVQLLHPYVTTGKAIALTIHTDFCWQGDASGF